MKRVLSIFIRSALVILFVVASTSYVNTIETSTLAQLQDYEIILLEDLLNKLNEQSMKKDILVEPNYVPYTLSLQYSGSILPNEQKVMTLVTSSSLGKNYDHARLTAEITKKPSNDATVQLFAIDSSEDVIDLLESGWGDAQGYKLGGENVNQKLNLSGLFSEEGDYTIHVKVVDRDASDAVIAENNFNVKVAKTNSTPQTTTSPSPENSSSPSPSTQPSKNTESSPNPSTNNEEVPSTLPKTGGMQYLFIILVFSILIGAYLYISRKNKNN